MGVHGWEALTTNGEMLSDLALEGFRVKWNHFTARKSRKTKDLDRDFDSIKIE
jgi:hypothetical protein